MIRDPRTVGCSSGGGGVGGECPDQLPALGRESCGLCRLTCDSSTMPPASPTPPHPRAAGDSSEFCKHVLHTRSLRDTIDSGRAPSVTRLPPYKQETTSCSNTNHSSQVVITSFQPRRRQGPRFCSSGPRVYLQGLERAWPLTEELMFNPSVVGSAGAKKLVQHQAGTCKRGLSGN